jgi:2,3,4,5-tetrahydropyridine-2-carboxylate N-succinyltransferase
VGSDERRDRALVDVEALKADVERLTGDGDTGDLGEAREVVARLLAALRQGLVRAAAPVDGGWKATQWVKAGILLAFRTGVTREYRPFEESPNPDFGGASYRWFDRDTLPLRPTRGEEENVRIVPGGSSVRDGAYLAPSVVVMPPAYINIGAWVGEGAMIDSHALVGSCAQVGKRVHLSAGAQLGGVLEPVGLRPVIIEDDALIAGNAGVFEGTLVGRRAVIGPGVQLTRSTPVYDLVQERVMRASAEEPLSIPEGAVVVPGARPAKGRFAEEAGVHLYVPVIVKYRDERTDAATALESALR